MWAKTLVFVGIKRIKKDLIAIVSSHCLLDGGADEARTRYLIVANDALSQVSYSPTNGITNTITPLYISQKVSFCQFFYRLTNVFFYLEIFLFIF